MSAKTKIVVLHMKSIIITGLLLGLGILLILFLVAFMSPLKASEDSSSSSSYTPGIYSSSILLGDKSVDVAVTVDENNINSIRIVNLEKSVETMYPLVKPALKDLSKQIIAQQSTKDITYSKNNQYTSLLLLDAVNDALEHARTPH